MTVQLSESLQIDQFAPTATAPNLYLLSQAEEPTPPNEITFEASPGMIDVDNIPEILLPVSELNKKLEKYLKITGNSSGTVILTAFP